MMHFPEGANYSVTTQFDNNGQVIKWYFDIIHKQGLTTDGIPYIDDLYLDLIYLPNGKVYVLDEDELEDALKTNVIEKKDYEMARKTLLE